MLLPPGRFLEPNVYFLPSSKALAHWLECCGFTDVRIVDEADTQLDEQRSTDQMTFQSLKNFLDPQDHRNSIEGYPAPRRAVLVATREK